jgi:hypothetical protein
MTMNSPSLLNILKAGPRPASWAVLADFEVLVLVAALIDDKQLRLVGGVKRKPRGCLVRHIGLRTKKIDFVLAKVIAYNRSSMLSSVLTRMVACKDAAKVSVMRMDLKW